MFSKARELFLCHLYMALISYALPAMPGFPCPPTAVEENKGFSSPGQCAQGCLDCHSTTKGKEFV